MAINKPKKRVYHPPSNGHIKNSKRPKWMRTIALIAMIIIAMVAVLGIVGAAMKYYRLVTK